MSILYQADASLNHTYLAALRRREPALDFQSAHSGGLASLPDHLVLEYAAKQNRILVSSDLRTMPRYFGERLAAGQTSPGLFLVAQSAPMAEVIEALLVIWAISDASEWRDQAFYLPDLIRHDFAR